MSEQEVRSWEETKLSHHNIGIPRMCLNEFLKDFKQSFHLSNDKLLETFTQTIKQLFLDCDISGHTSTIWGDLDEKSVICYEVSLTLFGLIQIYSNWTQPPINNQASFTIKLSL